MQNKTITELSKQWELGDIKLIEKFNTHKSNTYKVITDKSTYVIKEYNKDMISNYYYLKKRKEQIRISKILTLNKIPCLYPININEKNFIKFNDNYYLIYNYIEDQPITDRQLTIKNIRKLASTQAKIHNMNIKSTLPCLYKTVTFDTNKYLRKYKKQNEQIYNLLKENKDIFKEIVHKCNKCISLTKKNLVISHSEYKLKNILWNDDKMTIIEYDTTGKINPTAIMAESAFRFSYINNEFNYEFYKEYIKSYKKEINKESYKFKEALYTSFYGFINELKEKFQDQPTKANEKEIIYLIKEIITYFNMQEELHDIYFNSKKRTQ